MARAPNSKHNEEQNGSRLVLEGATWMLVRSVSTEDRPSAKRKGAGKPGGSAWPPRGSLSNPGFIMGRDNCTSSARKRKKHVVQAAFRRPYTSHHGARASAAESAASLETEQVPR